MYSFLWGIVVFVQGFFTDWQQFMAFVCLNAKEGIDANGPSSPALSDSYKGCSRYVCDARRLRRRPNLGVSVPSAPVSVL